MSRAGQLRPVLLSLLISILTGLICHLAGMPLPWMLGPMIGNTVAAMFGAPIQGPDRLRPFVMPVIGVMLGSSITASLFQQLGDWTATLVVLPIFLSIAAGISFVVYRKVGGYDSVTAFYAAMPGGLNEMLMLGAAAGGDEKRIALAHAARVLIVIFLVVVFFWLVLDVTSTGSTGWVALDAITVPDYAILTACAILGVFVGRALKLPAAPIFGPMLLSGVAHVAEWVTVAPPTLFIILAQLVIGTVIGARFVGTSPREVAHDLSLAVVSAFGMLIVAIGFATVITAQTGMDLSQAFLAFSPGGLTEMSLLSLALGQEVAYVSSIHLIRITVIIAIAPYVFQWAMRR